MSYATRYNGGTQPLKNILLCEAANKYDVRHSTEWSELPRCRVGPSMPSAPIPEIYYKDIGLIPNYAGHCPGSEFRHGQTFGKDTIDCKRGLKKSTC